MNLQQLISNIRVPSSDKDNQFTIEVAYESDYRRIIKSSSFRRLQDKTQVFPLERSDFVRTRLTHSLEVAMLSKSFLFQVIKELNEKGVDTTLLKSAFRLLESAELSKVKQSTKKVGYFFSETEIFQKIKQATGSGVFRHPLVYLIEAADDVSYTFSDLEDGYKYNMFSISDLQLYLNDATLNQAYFNQSWNAEEKIQKLLMDLQRKVYLAVSRIYVDNYKAILNGSFDSDLFIGNDHEIVLFNRLKMFCIDYIFNNKIILNQEIMGFNIINRLLSEFIPVVLKYDSSITMNAYEEKLMLFLPDGLRHRFCIETKDITSENDKDYYRLRMCVDYISGMTDSFAKKVYDELFRY